MTMQWIYFVLVFVPVHSHYSNSTGKAENLINTPCTDKNHFFLAPGVLTAGGTNRACISRFHPEGPARMLLSLLGGDNQTVTASRELPPGDGGCLDISVPLLPNTKADLVVNIWYPLVQCSWERRVTLRVSGGRVVVAHTERARYRPGDTLRARVFALKADLTPAPGNIEEIWLEGPPGAWEGTRVAQWTKVRSKMGLAQIQHEIDELAPPGRWTVRARLGDGSQGSAVFWVGNYELPPFQLTVRHAPRVLKTSERLVWTVCVRYPWTEAVEGMLVIRLRGAGSDSAGIRTAVRLRAPRACHRHAAAARRVGLGGDHPPDVVVADFSFQEEGTRVWQNTTVVSQVVDKPVTLEFLTKHTTVISPGLPYKLKVKATRWDDKPAVNERVRVCRYAAHNSTGGACASADTDAGGVARVMFAAGGDGGAFYRFEASLHNDSTTSTSPLTLETRRSPIQAALGPLRADSKGARTFVPLYLSLQNVTSPVTVHFVVITRGGIIYRWGATTQCPIASTATHIQTAARNSKCNNPMAQYDNNNNQYDKNNNQYDKNNNQYDKNNNQNEINNRHDRNNDQHDRSVNDKSGRSYDVNSNLYMTNKTNAYLTRNMNQNDKNNYLHKNDEKNHTIYDRFNPVHVNPDLFEKVHVDSIQYEANASDSLLDRYLLRVMLPIKVTQQMCPDSHLIAYFYYNGEFVSASKHFEMDDCFVNKVEASFVSRQALPGSLATLQVSTPGPALCALTALDSAAKWGPGGAVRDLLVHSLKRMIDGHRNITEYDAAGDCFLSAEVPQPLPSSLELTSAWLAAAGVRTVGEAPVQRSCDSLAALVDERTLPRTDFSEAWLWRLVSVGANGSTQTSARAPDSITRYEAGAVCLSKVGVAVSQPAVLQVFREFFIHADGPRRLRRGDSTFVRYRLFNYLYEPLSVQVQIVAGPGLQGPASVVEGVCVPPRASAARRVPLAATRAGEATFTIRAKAVNDGGCGNITNGRGVSDEVVVKIIIDPEGVPIQEHKSMLLCANDKSNSTSSQVSWTFPQAEMIPGTESLTVWAAGDIIGPLLADADSLVQLPRGCGEQNMARLATNLLALRHLHPRAPQALVAREHVARGFTRQLQYVHPSGGFSAFGPSDVTSSTWLTAFSLRYMRRAHQVVSPQLPLPPALAAAERWLLQQQMENGCFRNEGQVFHRELRGGLNEEGEIASVALAAYVVTSLLESAAPLPARALRSALACLRALPRLKHSAPARVYAHSLLAYALIRLKKYEEDLIMTNEAKYEDLRTSKPKASEAGRLQKSGLKEHEGLLEVMELIKMATREGEFLWWETGNLATSVEATGYALLALRASPAALREFGAGAVRWLSAHRAPAGGFVSTQDTLVALEALSAWSSLQPAPADLTVAARSGAVSQATRLEPSLRVPHVLHMGTGDQVTIAVEGSGCALVQATRRYQGAGGAGARGTGRLSVQLSVHTDGAFDCDAAGACYCAAVIQACAVWSGSFPEMALLEVALPGGYSADAARLYDQLREPDTLVRRVEVGAGGARATVYLAARGGAVARRGHACVAVHAVGPRARTRPAHVRLLDYYTPALNDTQIYTIPEECPSRVSHESSQDMTSDNLYNNARSMSDKDEILITHEFTFEDIPEGIPLEDPLYDNLTKDNKDISDLREKYATASGDETENSDNTNTSDNIDNITNISDTVAYRDKSNISDTVAYRDKTNISDTVTDRVIINNSDTAAYRDKTNPSDNGGNSDSVRVSSYNIGKTSHSNDLINQRGIYRFTHTNPWPIPNGNQGISPMRNVFLQIPVIEAYENAQQKYKASMSLKYNNPDRNKVIRADRNDALKPLNSGDKEIGVPYKSFDNIDEVQAGTEKTTINNIKDTTTYNYDYENQRSITSERTTKNNSPNYINNVPSADNAITRQTVPNHRIEIREEPKDSPRVENPVLSDFHVIDSEKDLEVPSGLEGPIPVVVLPPSNFIPPKRYTPLESFAVSESVPNNYVRQNGGPNNFAPLHGVRNNNFVPLTSAPNILHHSPNIEVQNAPSIAPRNAPNNVPLQNLLPNSFTLPNAPTNPISQNLPNGLAPQKRIPNSHLALHNAAKYFSIQNSMPHNFEPQNSVPHISGPHNVATQNSMPHKTAIKN